MKYLLQEKSFYQEFSDAMHSLATKHLAFDLSKGFFNVLEIALLTVVIVIIGYLLKLIVVPILRKLSIAIESNFLNFLVKHRVIEYSLYIIPLSLAFNLNIILFKANRSFYLLNEKIIKLGFVVLLTQIIYRIINTITDLYREENSYTNVGIRTFGQLTKMFVTFFAIISGIMILFTVDTSTIIAILGALTAAVILIFRDAILGFASGLQISYSKSVKEGDWVSIEKGKIDGIVREININLVKIERFDKSVVTVPTSDLIMSQVTNHEPMLLSGTRKIQRSIAFNVNSFKFCSEEMLDRFHHYYLIQDYISEKRQQLLAYNKNIPSSEIDINGRQLTNIGVFRIYVENYLRENQHISQRDPIIVKQLPVTMHGMPLEINCFALATDNLEYERIASDIFDHLLTACRSFDLEVMQNVSISHLKQE
ncbi:mechanosensitive ion channel family protein [Vaginella massiliensis]|uniref:mechanosensitive ion channel family protein n=1 Tax=Vaginella massiliensis TaxID=1816680 RepID=UPI000837FBD9|nr:mechanosensitive ion channel domain-containing protein [Vaginella massiliensis]